MHQQQWHHPWHGTSSGFPHHQLRCYGTRRPNSLSMRKANSLASRLAVQEVLGDTWRDTQQQDQQEQEQQQKQQKRVPKVIDTALPDLPVNLEPDHWRHIGRIEGQYSVDPQDAFAVVQIGPFQYKITADDVILNPKIKGVEVNDVLALGKVLLLGSKASTTIGRPYVPGACVIAAVESHFRDAKVHVFKKKPRKRYSKLKGHRSQITSLRVLQVLPEGLPGEWQLGLPAPEQAAQEAPQQAATSGAQ